MNNTATKLQVVVNPNSEERQAPTYLFIDPEQMVRAALRAELDRSERVRCVGEEGDPEKALELVQSEKPKIVITEIQLPTRSGFELVQEIIKASPETKCVFLTAMCSASTVQRALISGASGFVSKMSPFEELLVCLEAVALGEQYFSHDIRSLLPQRDVKTMQQGGGVDPLEALSPREREIFHLLAGGMQNAAIARKLFISPRTVETHRARIVRKLGIRTNSELIRFAIKNEVTFL